MTTSEIAHDLAALCRQNKNFEAVDKYYSENVVSIESMGSPEMAVRMEGLAAIRGKNTGWFAAHELHSQTVNGPFLGENQFVLELTYDVTRKESGLRYRFNELGLYTVADGKIVQEQFYYHVG